VPIASFGSKFAVFIIIGGLLLSLTELAWLGVILFGATVLFQVVTLPVELDASKRAKQELGALALVTNEGEQKGVSQVLTAAALTYVGAALSSILTLLYYVLRLSGGNRRD
jgi:Zn-dependent membrane protease YugP